MKMPPNYRLERSRDELSAAFMPQRARRSTGALGSALAGRGGPLDTSSKCNYNNYWESLTTPGNEPAR